ncbi:CsiV family protein [Zhongshania aquimaris]|uniref:Peptidoglycan binding protein CsiV n=1 Tax=Zhongshania aquimaris TaxID=2857107 RepID=A0ABS6VUH0_9GAMM|nr:CsiV family protein [Zhongshania aquimaris]MBW2941967.1 peptidoglycan binding protein CsiV [Zhongshania aquimaris]
MTTPSRRHIDCRPLRALLAVFVLTFSGVALSQNDNRFHIDLVVFANNEQASLYEEDWPDNLHLRYPRNWTRISSSASSPQKVDYMDPEFAQTLRSLRLSSRYKLLLQTSWQQDLTARKKSPAILIHGGKQSGNHYELEGYIRVAVERYLHLDTNLWLSSFGNRGGNYYLPRQPLSFDEPEEESGFVDESFESSPEYAEFLKQNPGYSPQRSQTQAQSGDSPIDRIVVMKQERRMRSNELHFIDHPRFGVIIKVSKISTEQASGEENAAQ